jgi:hypothetical protein
VPVSAHLAKLFAAERSEFNARAAEAKRRTPGFDLDAFAAFLQTGVDPVVAAVAAIAPERAADVAWAAYDIALVLVAHGLVGPEARCPLVERIWTELAPRIPMRVSESPTTVLGALGNAALYLCKTPGLRGEDWLREMVALAGDAANTDELLALGQALTWRAGAAHFRAGALAAADRLPPPLALAAVGAAASASWDKIKESITANPWWSPERPHMTAHSAVREVGAFAGFGGTFPVPPELRPALDGFWVKSAERYSLLIADAWGAVLTPATAEEFACATAPLPQAASLNGSRLTLGYGTIEVDLPAEGLALVSNEHTAALASPYTHAVRLYPLR